MPLYPDFKRLYQPGTPPCGSVVWLPIRVRDLLVQMVGETVALLTDTSGVQAAIAQAEPILLGERDGVSYLTCDVPPDLTLPEDWRTIDLRRLYGRIDEMAWTIAGYASHVVHWLRTSRFCPVCNTPSETMQQEWMLECAQCGHIRYPIISPAVLVLVHDGADRVLLSHQPGWGETYSILAGFVLPGESLEECVHREVNEEVGVSVTDLAYQGSQPWPFPQQLMIGFTARHLSGEIRIDPQELDHAAWFDVRELPPLPSSMSLSRKMLDAWIQTRRKVNE